MSMVIMSLESNIPISGFATLQIEYTVTVEQVSHDFLTVVAVKKVVLHLVACKL